MTLINLYNSGIFMKNLEIQEKTVIYFEGSKDELEKAVDLIIDGLPTQFKTEFRQSINEGKISFSTPKPKKRRLGERSSLNQIELFDISIAILVNLVSTGLIEAIKFAISKMNKSKEIKSNKESN